MRMSFTDTHTDWCACDHRCNLNEHRSEEITVDVPGYGKAVVNRVRASNGRDHAELRARLLLYPIEAVARQQLLTVLTDLRSLVTRSARIAYRKRSI